MNKTLKIFLYLIYTVAITVFFLYHLFPSDEVKAHIQRSLGRLNPDYSVRIDRIRPTFPPGLHFNAVGLFHRNGLLLEVKKINITAKIFSLFRAQKTMSFQGSTYGGILDGVVHISKDRAAQRFQVDARISGVQIQDISVLQKMPVKPSSGVLEATVLLDTRPTREPLKTNLTISDAELKLPPTFFTPGSLSFRSIRLEMALDQKTVQVRKSLISGRQIDGQFSGSVLFRNPLDKSILNLTGTIQPHPQFLANLEKTLAVNIFPKRRVGEKGFPIRIYNTIEAPKFALRP
ncbi:MAG: type II secretion system protein GspN [Desulfobacterales bacterium]|nr:type II secretion system protein GspN [Desulfobacterales bacterium]